MEARKFEAADKIWSAFLSGYSARRTLSYIDLDAIPLFVAVRYFWSLGLSATVADEDVQAIPDDAYLDRMLNYLRTWEAERIVPRLRAESPPTLYRGY